jgi:NifU-like protein
VSESPLVQEVMGRSGNDPGQGPFMHLRLSISERVIREGCYDTYQCPGCHACGKAILELLTGKTVEEARAIRHEDLVSRVGPLPRHRQICYGLALLALTDALDRLD